MSTELPTILALDPGGTTGWAIATPDMKVECGQLGPNPHYEGLWDLLCDARLGATDIDTDLHIVCERFEFRLDDRHRDKIDYSAARYEGVVDLFGTFARTGRRPRAANIRLVKQGASQIKGDRNGSKPFWGDDDKVKQTGLWSPGRRHAMDAIRHYLYYVTFTLQNQHWLRKLK